VKRRHLAQEVADYLRGQGFPHSKPAPGERVDGIPGLTVLVREDPLLLADDHAAEWLPDQTGLLVVRRMKHAPGSWWCWLRFHDLVQLADDAESGFAFPVRAELADVVMVLHSAGYGTPAEEVAS
jgi:hypothetical protein